MCLMSLMCLICLMCLMCLVCFKRLMYFVIHLPRSASHQTVKHIKYVSQFLAQHSLNKLETVK